MYKAWKILTLKVGCGVELGFKSKFIWYQSLF